MAGSGYLLLDENECAGQHHRQTHGETTGDPM